MTQQPTTQKMTRMMIVVWPRKLVLAQVRLEACLTKKKIFYVYRNEHQLDHAIAAKRPLSGIVEVWNSGVFIKNQNIFTNIQDILKAQLITTQSWK